MSLQQQNQIKPIVQSSLLLQTKLVSRWIHIHRMWGHNSRKWRVTHLSRVPRTCGLCHSPPSSDSTASARGSLSPPQCGSVLLSRRLNSSEKRRNNRWLCNKQFLLKVNLAAFERPGWVKALSALSELKKVWDWNKSFLSCRSWHLTGVWASWGLGEAQPREITSVCLWAFRLPDMFEHPNQSYASSPQLNSQMVKWEKKDPCYLAWTQRTGLRTA